MRILAPFLVVVVLAMHSSAAQQRPDLTGTWTAGADVPSGATLAPSPLLGPRFALQQQGDTLTVRRVNRSETIERTFTIGGGEVHVRVPGRLCEGDAMTIENVAWAPDGALAHSIVGAISAGTRSVRAISDMTHFMTLEGPDTLVVRRTFPARGETAARTLGTVYKRSADRLPDPAPEPAVKTVPATIGQVAWIAANWAGAATPTPFTVEELWRPPASGSMIALGRTLQEPLLVRFELLCIVEQRGSLVYFAMPQGRMPPTPFYLTNISADSATFENPANNYPKVVRYSRRPDGSLETMISGANNERAETIVLQRRN